MPGTPAGSGYFAESIMLRAIDFERFPGRGRTDDGLRSPEPQLSCDVRVLHAKRLLQAEFELTIGDDEGDDPFVVNLELVGIFSWREPVSVEPAQFAEWNIAAIMWPFARELVWNLTVRSGTGPLTLPISNFAGAKTEVTEVGERSEE